MDSQFHQSTRFSNADLAGLMARSNRPGLLRFGLQYSLFCASAALVILGPELALPLWLQGLGGLGVALLTLSLFATVHETGHNTAFASKDLNRAVCWLAALPHYYTPTGFRVFHFAHHRHTHDPLRDPEISLAGKAAPSLGSSIWMYLGYLTGLPLLLYKVTWLIAAAIGVSAVWKHFLIFVPEHAQRQHSREARLALLFHGLWLTAGVFWLPGLLHLLLAQWLGHSFLSLYTFCEHTGLPEEGDILRRTRTTLTHPLITWLVWNMPYHAEHHAYPALPFHALPRLHSLLAPELQVTQKGYISFHGRVLGQLLRGKAFREFRVEEGASPMSAESQT